MTPGSAEIIKSLAANILIACAKTVAAVVSGRATSVVADLRAATAPVAAIVVRRLGFAVVVIVGLRGTVSAMVVAVTAPASMPGAVAPSLIEARVLCGDDPRGRR